MMTFDKEAVIFNLRMTLNICWLQERKHLGLPLHLIHPKHNEHLARLAEAYYHILLALGLPHEVIIRASMHYRLNEKSFPGPIELYRAALLLSKTAQA